MSRFMRDDTQIGGPDGRFPPTRWSAVAGATSDDPGERARALEILVAAYWKPVYKYLRLRWKRSNEDAKDLTQEFFALLLEKGFLDRYDPARARLRTFLRTCLDRMVQKTDRASKRLKRGGDRPMLSLDFVLAEAELTHSRTDPLPSADEYFEREWIRSLFGLAVEALREVCEQRGKSLQFRLFERYDLETGDGRRPTYGELANEFEIAVSDVTNHLAFARREFRRIALAKLQEMTVSEDEFRREARSLLGVSPR